MNTDLKNSIYLLGPTITYRRNSEIFGESEPADSFYKVISGSVRAYKTLSDGRRQIGGFYMPGDVFGPNLPTTTLFRPKRSATRN